MFFFFFKPQSAYEVRISAWSSACALPISGSNGGSDGARSGARIGRHCRRHRRGSRSDVAHTVRRPVLPLSRRVPDQRATGGGDAGPGERKSGVWGKRVAVRVDPGGRGIVDKKKRKA